MYRPSDCRLSAKLVPAFEDRGCHVVSVADPYGLIPGFLYRYMAKLFCAFPPEDDRMTETCSGWEIIELLTMLLLRRLIMHLFIQWDDYTTEHRPAILKTSYLLHCLDSKIAPDTSSTWERSCLKHYATSRKGTESVPNEALDVWIGLVLPASLRPWDLIDF
jgi:hypothetical protein